MNHILIVEDDTTFALMLQTWLTKKGFAITSVSGVGAARRALQDEAVDLVLCDLRLPDGEGIDLLEWLNARRQPVPVIVMTSYAAIPSAVQAMKLGAKDYIAKPVNPEDLLQKINEVLGPPSVPSNRSSPSQRLHPKSPAISRGRAKLPGSSIRMYGW